MFSQHKNCKSGPRRRRGRRVVRLNTAALWERLALLNRSQNWLAREIGVSPGYVSMLVNEGRAPSGRIRTADAQGPRRRTTFTSFLDWRIWMTNSNHESRFDGLSHRITFNGRILPLDAGLFPEDFPERLTAG